MLRKQTQIRSFKKRNYDAVSVPRDLVMATKGPDTPIVIVGNKTDLAEDRVVSKVRVSGHTRLT